MNLKTYFNEMITILSIRRTITFDWSEVLAFAVFYVYGFYGAMQSPKYPEISIVLTIISTILFAFFLLLPRYFNGFKSEFQINIKDIFTYFLFLIFSIIISSTYLFRDITIDQIYHSYWAIIQSIHIAELLGSYFPGISEQSSLLWVSIINLFLIVINIGVIFLIKKRSLFSIITLLLIFIIFRIFVYYNFDTGTPHPQLRLLPIWISSLFGGINNFGFRLSSLLGLAFLMTYLYGCLRNKLPLYYRIVVTLASCTIPVLLHSGSIVEPSIWATIYLTIILTLILFEDLNSINLTNLFCLFTIFFLMRQSIIACLLSLMIFFIIQYYNKRFKRSEILILIISITPMILIFLKSLYMGTPGSIVTDTSDSAIKRVWISITSGISKDIFFSSFHFPLGLFFLLSFIPFSKNDILRSILTTITFVSFYIVFFSANTTFWGSGRYLAEFIVPFIIIGIVKLSLILNLKKALRISGSIILIVLLCSNIYYFLNLNSYSKNLTIKYPKERTIKTVISESNNNYSEVLTFIKSKEAGARVLFADEWIYYNLPFIMKDFTLKECIIQKHLMKEFVAEGKFNLANVPFLENIEYIIINYNEEDKIEGLKSMGWQRININFQNSEYCLLQKKVLID